MSQLKNNCVSGKLPQNMMRARLIKIWYIFNQYTQTEEDILPQKKQVPALLYFVSPREEVPLNLLSLPCVKKHTSSCPNLLHQSHDNTLDAPPTTLPCCVATATLLSPDSLYIPRLGKQEDEWLFRQIWATMMGKVQSENIITRVLLKQPDSWQMTIHKMTKAPCVKPLATNVFSLGS